MTRGAVQIHTDKRAPTDKPPFTIGSLRKAIPAHCFERSLSRSFGYLGFDLLLVALLYAFSQIVEAKAPLWLAVIAWPAYWFFQVSTIYILPAPPTLNQQPGFCNQYCWKCIMVLQPTALQTPLPQPPPESNTCMWNVSEGCKQLCDGFFVKIDMHWQHSCHSDKQIFILHEIEAIQTSETLQGAVCTGLWVIAHECGHQAFSKYQTVNDAVGIVLHSSLLVPYFSW